MTVKPIETTWNGHRFRSRTEARWAVFFTEAGIKFDYEREGYKLPSGWYLPDFWLTDIGMWFEVKGEAPTDLERALCEELCAATFNDVLLAVGPPKVERQIEWFRNRPLETDEAQEDRYFLQYDRRDDNVFWLGNSDCGYAIGPAKGTNHGRVPGIYGPLERAYRRATSERFDGKP